MATVTTIAYRLKYGNLFDFSPQSLINNGIIRVKDAIKHMLDKEMGIQEHSDDPFVHVRCKPYRQSGPRYTLENCKLIDDPEEMKEAIKYNFGPWGPKLALLVSVDDINDLTKHEARAAWYGEPYRRRKAGGEEDCGNEDDGEKEGHGGEEEDDGEENDDDKEDDGEKEDDADDNDDDKEDVGLEVENSSHAMVLTGLDASSLYDDEHVLELQNSYGKRWGGNGYTRVTYDFIETLLIPVMKGDVEDMKERMKKRRHHLHLSTLIGGKENTVKDGCSRKQNRVKVDDWSKGKDSIEFKCFSYEHFSDSRNKDVDTIERHPVLINAIGFSDDGSVLAAACEDGAVWRLHLEEAARNSFKCRRLTMPKEYETYQTAVAVTFADNDSSLVVACKSDVRRGTYLNTYCKDTSNGGDDQVQFRYENESHQSHHLSDIVGLYGSKASGADGSTILVTSSGGTDVWASTETWNEKLIWLEYPHAIISPNGRYIAAATSTHAVKIWEIKREKYGGKRVEELRLFEGHKHAVKGMCFTPDMMIITSSLDGTLRVWNIEGPDAYGNEAWMAFPPPRHNSKETQLHYDCVSMSPDGDILAVSQGKVLQWISFNTREVLDTAVNAHEGIIRSITWAPKAISVGGRRINVLATLDDEKKMKLWKAPDLP